MPDDGFRHVSCVEQHCIFEGHRQGFHLCAQARHQRQALAQQPVRPLFSDIAFIAEQFSGQAFDSCRNRRCIADIAGRECDGDDLVDVIEHQMQLESDDILPLKGEGNRIKKALFHF